VPRRVRGASGPDAIDQDGDAAKLHAEDALDRGTDRCTHLGGEGDELLARPCDKPQRHVHAPVPDADPDGVASERIAPCRTAPADAQVKK